MKKTILIAMIALLATTVVIAKEGDQQRERRGPDPEKRIDFMVDRLDKGLELTEEQEQQIKGFYSDFDKAQQARMEEMRKQAKADREALDGKIESVLTADQKAKYAEMKKQGQEKMKEGRGGHGHGRGHGHGTGGMGPGGHGHGHGHGPGHCPSKDAVKSENTD